MDGGAAGLGLALLCFCWAYEIEGTPKEKGDPTQKWMDKKAAAARFVSPLPCTARSFNTLDVQLPSFFYYRSSGARMFFPDRIFGQKEEKRITEK